MERNLRFKIDWASLIVGRKLITIFALFYFVFEGNFQVPAPGKSLYLEGLIFGILRYAGFILVECLIFTNVLHQCTCIYILKKLSISSAGVLQGLYRVNIFSPFQLCMSLNCKLQKQCLINM